MGKIEDYKPGEQPAQQEPEVKQTIEVEAHSKLDAKDSELYARELERRIVEQHKKTGTRMFDVAAEDFEVLVKYQRAHHTGVMLAEASITLIVNLVLPAGEFEFKKD